MAYPNSEFALSLFLVPLMKNKQAYQKALIHSLWITGIALLLLTALVIMVLGESLPPNMPYVSQFAVFFFNLLCPLLWYTAHKLRNRLK